jgi:hypothetical protein
MVKENKPNLVETKLSSSKSIFLKHKVGFDHIFSVDSIGRSGGVFSLLWRSED